MNGDDHRAAEKATHRFDGLVIVERWSFDERLSECCGSHGVAPSAHADVERLIRARAQVIAPAAGTG
jgi:hypothetical protein